MQGNVVLISTYELGRQPFGLASVAAWLKTAGASVSVQDLSVTSLKPDPLLEADLIAFYVPMHTATRLAESVLVQVKQINSDAHICFFGLYAPMNESHVRSLGVDTVIGGEFEEGLVSTYRRVVGVGHRAYTQTEPTVSLNRQQFLVPDRSGLPELGEYARLQVSPGIERVVGYTEASRGCQHLCRHCPVVPVYNGRFVVVQPDVVLEDVRRQVRAGAEHITFGDPDFFNGPKHALRIVRRMHEEFPELSYDVTIKIEHLRRHAHLLADLKATGCVLVTSAIESFDESILDRFDKQHATEDLRMVIATLDGVGLALNPTFVTFTPWTSVDGYAEFMRSLAHFGLVENMSPVQYAIRLLIPAGSKLLELSDVADLVSDFDSQSLFYPWTHPDPAVDRLFDDVRRIVTDSQRSDTTRREIFDEVWNAVLAARDVDAPPIPEPVVDDVPPLASVPYLTEPWYC